MNWVGALLLTVAMPLAAQSRAMSPAATPAAPAAGNATAPAPTASATAPAPVSPSGSAAGSAPAPSPSVTTVTAGAPCGLSPEACPTNLAAHWDITRAALFNWSSLGTPLLTVVPSQTITSHDGYPTGVDGWADHYRVELIEESSGKLTRHLIFPSVFHQDERYQPLGDGYPWSMRVGHALRHLVWTSSADHERTVFNMSGVPASVANALLDNLYEPPGQRYAGNTYSDFRWGVGMRVVDDLLSEFAPDIARLLPPRLAALVPQ